MLTQVFRNMSNVLFSKNVLTPKNVFLSSTLRLSSNFNDETLKSNNNNTEQNQNQSTLLTLKPTEKDKLYSRLEIELKGIDSAVLNSYSWFATTAANHLGIEVGKCWALKRPYHDRLTLLKSVHIYKKHRVQYEIRTYFRFMIFHKLTGSTMDTFLEYLERNLPEGVALKTTKVEIQKLPEHLQSAPNLSIDK